MTASTSETDPSLESAIFARLHPAAYLSKFLASSIRPDGRSFDSFRPSNLALSSIQTAEGSCTVRQGSTVVVAGVKAEILDLTEEANHGEFSEGEEEEEEEEKGEGEGNMRGSGLGPVDRKRVIVGVELSPMASARFKSGPPGEEAQVLASRLMTILESCPPLNTDSLIISKGISSWCLYVDLVCLSYDGNALDASLLAIAGALKDTRLPHAQYDETIGQTICSPDPSRSKTLGLQSHPLSFTFGIIEGTYLLADLDAFESALASSSITVTLKAGMEAAFGTKRREDGDDDDIAHVHCTGLCSALISPREASAASVQGSSEESGMVRVKDEELISICIQRARKRCSELTNLLDKS